MKANQSEKPETVKKSKDGGLLPGARALQGLGIAFLFVPMSQVAYSYLPRGKNNKASSLTNLFRNQGASFGIAFVTTVLARRAQYHQSVLVTHVTSFAHRQTKNDKSHREEPARQEFGSPDGRLPAPGSQSPAHPVPAPTRHRLRCIHTETAASAESRRSSHKVQSRKGSSKRASILRLTTRGKPGPADLLPRTPGHRWRRFGSVRDRTSANSR